MAEKWYNLTPEQIESRLSTDLVKGLGSRQASARLRREGKNTVYRVERPKRSALIWDVLRDPCAYMLLVAAVLAWIFDESVGAPVIIALTVLNALFVLTAYIKARLVIADAHEQSIPVVTVIRGGKQYFIRQDRVCRGDIIVLTKGDIVPADARLTESRGLRVIEVNVTGEAGRKRKEEKIIFANNLPPEKQADMVFAGSVVAEGQAKAVVCETGEDTLISLMGKTEQGKEEKQDPGILLSLKRFCSVWSFIMLVMVFCLTLFDFIVGFESRSIFNIFVTGLSIATAGMCEYYLVFGYIIIGCSMFDMSGRTKKESFGAVVKNVGDLDKLSDITTLIVPKEGAFTAGKVGIKKLYFDSVLYAPDERNLDRNCEALISAALDSTSYPENDYEKTYNRFKARDASVEDNAIYTLAHQSGVFDGPRYMASHILVDRKTEDEIVKSMMALNGKNRLVLRGAPNNILPMCSHYRTGESVRLIKQEKSRAASVIKELSAKGLYALCIATKETDDMSADDRFVFEGLIVLNRPQLVGVKENVERMQAAGIRVIMLAEDSSSRAYARTLGILSDDSQVMTAEQLGRMSDDLFRTNITEYTLYEGLDVPQKRVLVKHLRESGERVGFFGCDFEDIILIRESDVGFSTGVTLNRGDSVLSVGSESAPVYISSQEEKGKGSEALKQACDVIVAPAEGSSGGFNSIVSALARGRRALGSLYRMVRYLMISQCARLFVFLYSAMIPMKQLPFCGEDIFTPVQLLLLGLVFDLAVVMAYAHGSSKGAVTQRQSKVGFFGCILFGVFWGVCSLVFPVILRLCKMGLTNNEMSTMVFFGFLATSLITAFECASDGSVFKKRYITNIRAILAILITALFTVLCAFTGLFGTCMLSGLQWVMMLLLPLVMLGVFEIYKSVKGNNNDRNKKA